MSDHTDDITGNDKMPSHDDSLEGHIEKTPITQGYSEPNYSEPSEVSQQDGNIASIQQKIDGILKECSKLVIGQQEVLELMIVCMLSDGHVLLEGVPGIAKTLSAKTLARTVDAGFSRIQFTPDLMPTDIIGTSVFNMKESVFVFKKGPIYSNLILIDEINRAPAKTQSALFEVMEEKQISYDGEVYEMDAPFMVIATQNPVEQEGTYRLPEAQLDRFLMKITLGYPSIKNEISILERFSNDIGVPDVSVISAVVSKSEISAMKEAVSKIYIKDDIMKYIVELVAETREHSKIYLGASPRASLAIMRTSKVVALMAGRNFVIPEDIQYIAPFILNHRIILTPDAEMEGTNSQNLIKEIIKAKEVPR